MTAAKLTPKSNFELQKQQYHEWVRILTAAPIRRSEMQAELSAFGVSLFVFASLIAFGIVILRPFWQGLRPSYYANLAAIAFTALTFAICGLVFLFISWIIGYLRPYLHLLLAALRIFLILFGVLFIATFLILFMREVLRWVLAPDGLALFWKSLFQFLQSIF